jgi:hypothetical protein
MLMEQFTRVTGYKTSSMAWGMKFGLMDHLMLETTFMEKKKELVFLNGLMEQNTQASGLMTSYKDLGFTNGMTADHIEVNGKMDS